MGDDLALVDSIEGGTVRETLEKRFDDGKIYRGRPRRGSAPLVETCLFSTSEASGCSLAAPSGSEPLVSCEEPLTG